MERRVAVKSKSQAKALLGPELKVGDAAPDFRCVDTKLQPVVLADTEGRVRIFSVVPSLDTPVCDIQTKRFNDESAASPVIDIYSISTDLPYAERRYVDTFGVDDVKMLSDHLDTSFGVAYGVLIPDFRILTRAIFVIDCDGIIQHAEYVPEINEPVDFEAALTKAKELAGQTAAR